MLTIETGNPRQSGAQVAARLGIGHWDESAREVAAMLVERGVDQGDVVALGFAGVVYALLDQSEATYVDVSLDAEGVVAERLGRLVEAVDALTAAHAERPGQPAA